MSLSKSYVVREAMSEVNRPNFVLRNADRFGDEAFEKWLLELRDGFQRGTAVINKYLLDHATPEETTR